MAATGPVPFFNLDRQYRRYRETFLAITDRVLAGGQVLQGQEVGDLETALAACCHRRFAVAVGSGTDALVFALLAGGIQPGDEILVTAFSFIASSSAIVRVGAVPRFVDVDPGTAMMDLSLMSALLTPRTRGIVGVHLYGQTLPMDELTAFADRHGLLLIEDAAQALGARDGERPAGSMGRASCLSFDPTKVVGSFSSGGAVVTDDEALAARVRRLRYHGRDPDRRGYLEPGFNSQLSSEMAAMLSFKLAQLPVWIQERGAVAAAYQTGLGDLPEALVTLPRIRPGSTHNWHKYVIQTDPQVRDRLLLALQRGGIAAMVHYPRVMGDEPMMHQYASLSPGVERARGLSRSVLSLPIHPELTPDECGRVVAAVRGFFAQE